ncbi:glycoside hydrolase domain-containing protein [Streptomyces coelicoflavus]|uniref:glycoside hydrolase domain-containing protein n=1 Tax=Streptomyces coelicoflavus TaxID=285562 RepID=UPI00368AF5DA
MAESACRRPDRTAERVRALLSGSYRLARDGWPGNDDSGAMSALYVFSSMGLFLNTGQDS